MYQALSKTATHFYCFSEPLRVTEVYKQLAEFFGTLPEGDAPINHVRDIFNECVKNNKSYGTLFRNVNHPESLVRSDTLHRQLCENTPFSSIRNGQLVWGIDRDNGYLIIVGGMWNIVLRFDMKETHWVRCAVPSSLSNVVQKATLDTAAEVVAVTSIIDAMEEYHHHAKRLEDAYINHFNKPRGNKE